MATIKDIAERTGYSIATVSRALNNQRNVDEKIKKKILQTASELNYKPNLLGQILRNNTSNLVLCTTPSMASGLLYESFISMQETLNNAGYQLLLYPGVPDNSTIQSQSILTLLEGQLISGIIFTIPFLESSKLNQLNQKYPLVQFSEYEDNAKTAIVSVDYFEAVREGIDYLIHIGHSRIAFITLNHTPTSPISISMLRKELGYKYALDSASIPYDPNLIIRLDSSDMIHIQTAINQLFSSETKPTALFCISDVIASRCLKALEHSGLKVPNDCSVMGFDNTTFTDMVPPSLTTIGSPLSLMGKRAAELLLHQIETGEKTNEKILLSHKLIIRESTSQLFS